jgi:hypothetical protein
LLLVFLFKVPVRGCGKRPGIPEGLWLAYQAYWEAERTCSLVRLKSPLFLSTHFVNCPAPNHAIGFTQDFCHDKTDISNLHPNQFKEFLAIEMNITMELGDGDVERTEELTELPVHPLPVMEVDERRRGSSAGTFTRTQHLTGADSDREKEVPRYLTPSERRARIGRSGRAELGEGTEYRQRSRTRRRDSNSSMDSSPYQYNRTRPWTRYTAGYPRFSAFVASDEDRSTTIFRRFQPLSARNLLYLESELSELEAEQDRLDEESKHDFDLGLSAQSWELLCQQAQGLPPSRFVEAQKEGLDLEERLGQLQAAAQERLHLALRIREVLTAYRKPLPRND